MKRVTKIFTMILAVILILASLPTVSFATTVVDSGECGADGDNVTWTLNSDGLLTISGIGEMADYEWDVAPWSSNNSDVKEITIENGVTSIGSYSFYDTEYYNNSENWEDGLLYIGKWMIKADSDTIATSVSVKEGTIGIAGSAFCECFGLESITIPADVTSINDYAFYGCSGLESINIPVGVTSIGNWAFSGCTGLTSITIPESVTSIGDNVFTDCSANLTVKCYKDSYAAKYAVDNSIKYEYMHKHTWDNGIVTKAATCKDTGIMTYTCTECKTTKTETIAKTDAHTFGEWVVKTAATYEADGEEARTCSVCGKEETKTIAKLVASKSADDKTTGVQMNFAEETFTESNVTLEVKTATKDTEVFKIVSNLKPNNNFEIFDISAMSGTTKVQPNGNVQITIPLPEKFDSENVSIYYVNDKGEMEKLQSYVKDGKIVFETNHFSYYVVVDEISKKEPDGLSGDINGDGKITAKDARAILRYSAKLDTFTNEQISVADVNNDGKINAKDARKVLRVSAKLETM